MAAEMLQNALWLVEHRGCSVIALDHPAQTTQVEASRIGKVPIGRWEAFQRTPPTPDNLRSWFGNGKHRNLGIVTGAVSGLVAVDCDSVAAVAWADTHLPPTPMRTQTARGEHRYYRHPGDGPVRNAARVQTGDPAVTIDIRGDGGFVVAPCSVHASGVEYQRLGEWPPVSDLPVFQRSWIETRVQPPAPAPAPPAGVPVHGGADVLTRARAYLAATPPAIEGQGGDPHTYQVACRLVRGFDLSDAEALDLLRAWNAGCVPPWSDLELDAKLTSARRYGTEPVGARRDQPTRRATTPKKQNAITTLGAAPPADGEMVFHYTDSGNAEAFTAWHGDDLRYDHRRGRWLVWDTHRWQPDADAKVRRRAKAAMRRRLQTAAAITDDDKRKRAVKWSLDSESRGRLEACVSLAQAELPIADAGDGWDTDPWLLATPSGVVDLRTGQARPGRRSDRLTMSTGVPFDPDATCPRWERFVSEVFAGDAELMSFVHRAVGYSLSGITTEQCLFLLYGSGANGKGTFSKTLMAAFGDYASNMPFSTIEMHQRAAIPNDLAALVGRRFVVASETNDEARLNEARIKALTGCDPITARFLHSEFFTFDPLATFWLSVNHKPVVRDDSHGFWRRIRLVPFTQTFPVTPGLAEDLHAELPGILAWAVRGCLAWQRDGLVPPSAVVDATQTYASDSDPLAGFIDDACVVAPGVEAGGKLLFDNYRSWAIAQGLSEREQLSSTAFGGKLATRFERVRRERGHVYFGIAPRNDGL
jgi:putative DNA primase/helicase